jgi:hypothetical protein
MLSASSVKLTAPAAALALVLDRIKLWLLPVFKL